MLNDLLGCPFCGAAPEILPKKTVDADTGEIVDGHSIQCVNNMCGMRPYTYPCPEGNVWMFRLNWNQRSEQPNVELDEAEEAPIYLTPAELQEKQTVLNSAMRSMLDNIKPNAELGRPYKV